MRLVLFLFLNICIVFFSHSQCKLNYEISVEQGATNQIVLKLKDVDQALTLKLYRVSNTVQFVSEKTIGVKSFNSEKIIVFSSLPSAFYFIQVVKSDCQFTIGGMEGIKINETK